ncbi:MULTISPECIES: hypothetical protein [unclassified Paenarthrobacter]|uniref:hypothetical protein n=1 Tax=unclassified Paenarthrobacter TaxID=2634190 RepID=UPI003CE83435
MYKAQDIIPAVQDVAGEWVRHAAEGTSSQTDAVVRWALGRINHADVPGVVHGVVLTLTGNRKSARKARRTAAKAVVKASRALRSQAGRTQALSRSAARFGAAPARPSRPARWLIFLSAAGIGAAAVVFWRMLMPPGEPAPVKPTEQASGGEVPPETY